MPDEVVDLSQFVTPDELPRAYPGRVQARTLAALDRVMRNEGLTFPQAWAALRDRGHIIETVRIVGTEGRER